ncbi:MAG: protein kinase [Planctomycetota bacterium]
MRPPLRAGDVVAGRFHVLGALGEGGMGEVYRAEDRDRGAQVALKLLPSELCDPDPEALRRFEREAELAARVDAGGGVVRVHSYGLHLGRPYCAMEVLEGGSLGDALRRGLEPDALLRLVEDLARTLGRLHAAGVVHRDVKPQNVLLDEQGRAKLCDFGLARDLSAAERLTLSSEVLGTPAYMAPEQAKDTHAVTGKVDVYPLGVILYEAVTGRLPFEGSPLSVLERLIQDTPPPTPSSVSGEVSPALEAVILRAMAPDPAARYDALELAEALAALRRGEGPPRPGGRGWLRALAALVLLAGALGLALWARARARRDRALSSAAALASGDLVGWSEPAPELAARARWALAELQDAADPAAREARARLEAWDLWRRRAAGEALELDLRRVDPARLPYAALTEARVLLGRAAGAAQPAAQLTAARRRVLAAQERGEEGSRALAAAVGRELLLAEHLAALAVALEAPDPAQLARRLVLPPPELERFGPLDLATWRAARQEALEAQAAAWAARLAAEPRRAQGPLPRTLELLRTALHEPVPTAPGPRLRAVLDAWLTAWAEATRAEVARSEQRGVARACELARALWELSAPRPDPRPCSP